MENFEDLTERWLHSIQKKSDLPGSKDSKCYCHKNSDFNLGASDHARPPSTVEGVTSNHFIKAKSRCQAFLSQVSWQD